MVSKRPDFDEAISQEDALASTTPPAQQPGEPVRRVYALPAELVERIVEFQKEKNLASEVEAARRLLDEALKSRDTPTKLINRFLGRLAVVKVATEAAKDVLVGHPMIEYLRFSLDSVSFSVKDKAVPEVTIQDSGRVTFDGSSYKWISASKVRYSAGHIDDGEIPF